MSTQLLSLSIQILKRKKWNHWLDFKARPAKQTVVHAVDGAHA